MHEESDTLSVYHYKRLGYNSCCCPAGPCRPRPVRYPSKYWSSNWWYRYIFGGHTISKARLCSSYFSIFSPWVIFGIRLVFSIYNTIGLVFIATLRYDGYDPYWLFFLTNISNLFMVIYLWLSCFNSWLYVRDAKFYDRTQSSSWLDSYLTIMYGSLFVTHINITFGYWVFLGGPEWAKSEFEYYLGVHPHGLNNVVWIFEFLMTRVIFMHGQFLFHLAFVIMYLLWTVVGHYAYPTGGPHGNGWPYPFSDPKSPLFPILTLGMPVYMWGWWNLVLNFHWFRSFIAHRYFGAKTTISSQ